MKNQAFTLIELLVVVLIIGILAAIAVPYYYESVEKSTMQEAIINLKAIAQANDVFFLQNGRYADMYELNKLDVSIPGEITGGTYNNRRQTKYFVYSPNGAGSEFKALAQRLPFASTYYIAIQQQNDQLVCNSSYGGATAIQTKLCDQINRDGHL